jgi:hypothetical protein
MPTGPPPSDTGKPTPEVQYEPFIETTADLLWQAIVNRTSGRSTYSRY